MKADAQLPRSKLLPPVLGGLRPYNGRKWILHFQCWQDQLAECFPRPLTSLPSNTEIENICSWGQYRALKFRSLLKTCDNELDFHATQELQVLLNRKATQNDTWCFHPSDMPVDNRWRLGCSRVPRPLPFLCRQLIKVLII